MVQVNDPSADKLASFNKVAVTSALRACCLLALTCSFAVIAPSAGWASGVYVEAHGLPANPCSLNFAISGMCSSNGTGGQASSFADLATGTLTASVAGQAISEAQLTDYITFHLPVGYLGSNLPVTITLNAHGTVSGDVLDFSTLFFGNTSETGCLASGIYHCNTPGLTQGLALSITENLSLSALTHIYFQAEVNPQTGGSGGSSTIDPDIILTLPVGVYFTSDSGVFLTQTETPLPAALPLFATGLGGLGVFSWRRKRRAQAFA